MKYISAEQVYGIGYPAVVEALKQAHCGDVPITETALLQHGEGEERQSFLALPAWLPGEIMGVKMVNVLPGNEDRHGLPNIQAAYQLFDGANGRPTVAIDGTALTYVKTAADSALAASFLAREDARTLLMVGAGGLGPHLIEAHCAVRPSIDRILIWNRTDRRSHALAEQLMSSGVEATAVTDIEKAASEADIVSCATATFDPLIHGAWLTPGTHLDLVGSFTTDMREADDEAAARSTIFVDTRWKTIGETGDIDGPLASGAITEADMVADLYELSRGTHPGRTSHDEITFFKNSGGGHLDLYVARALAEAFGNHDG